ncbi:MAG: MFS transporter [Dehalococcoidia bacterium]|nr:MFS transporter [Dehalococcoidia bacterium]
MTAPLLRPVGWLIEWRVAVLLGIETIGAYGMVLYAIGVLVAPIQVDTGWSTGALSTAFAVGILLSGVVAVGAGYALDRAGSRVVFLSTLAGGATLLLLASQATTAAGFIATWGLGAALVGGGLCYPMTMATLSRIYPERRAEALSILTLLGALASPIFYPLAGWLVEAYDWREAMRALVLVMVVLIVPGALVAQAPPPQVAAARSAPTTSIGTVLREANLLRLLLAVSLASAATSALLLHQVPAMQATGLSLNTASGFAGVRGFLQIPGRLALARLTSTFGLRGTATLAYATGAVGAGALCLALAGGPAVVLAVIFALTAGLAVGMLAPVHGLLAAKTYGAERLGTLSGMQQFVASIAGAAGPWLSGVLVDRSEGYLLPLLVPLAALLGAIVVLASGRRRSSK